MRLRNLPLHWKIILGMFLEVLFGFLMSNFDSTGKELTGADLAKSLNNYTEVYVSLWYAKKIGFLSN